jgi:hypothetical protein
MMVVLHILSERCVPRLAQFDSGKVHPRPLPLGLLLSLDLPASFLLHRKAYP